MLCIDVRYYADVNITSRDTDIFDIFHHYNIVTRPIRCIIFFFTS